MFNVSSRKSLSLLSRRILKHNKARNRVAICAIILTAVLFTSVFSIGMSVIDSFQQSTMRQVGTKAHGGFKYLTEEQYRTVASDPKIKDISYNIFIAVAENPELAKVYTEIRYSEENAAEWSFCKPETGRLPESGREIAVSDSVLDALGVLCELGAEVPLEFTANGIKYSDIFTLCGFWHGESVISA